MEAKFVLLAEAVNETRDGRANIIGEFDRVHSTGVPVTFPRLYVIARFEAEISEGSEHTIQIRLIDEDGQEVLQPPPAINLPFKPRGRGKPLRANTFFELSNIRLPKFGDYSFDLLVDGRFEARATLTLEPVSDTPG